MVKGISRQVIVVRSPDPKLFEQAIFILRDDALNRGGLSDKSILRQAQLAADGYLSEGRREKVALPGAVYAILGAVAMGVLWAVTLVI